MSPRIVTSVLILLVGGAVHAAEPPASEAPAAETPAGEARRAGPPAQPEVPAGWVAIEERYWDVLADEPILHFYRARKRLESQEEFLAAVELRKGAAFLRVEAARALPDTAVTLMDSVDELEFLAGEVQAKRAPGDEIMDGAFARAHHALAVTHVERALASFETGDPDEARERLEVAARHVESADSWSGGVVGKGARAVADQARKLAGGVVRADGWAIKQVGNAIRGLGSGLETLGKKIQPGPSQEDD